MLISLTEDYERLQLWNFNGTNIEPFKTINVEYFGANYYIVSESGLYIAYHQLITGKIYVVILNLETEELYRLHDSVELYNNIVFNKDETIVAYYYSNFVTICDVKTGLIINKITTHPHNIKVIKFKSIDEIIILSTITFFIYNIYTGEIVNRILDYSAIATFTISNCGSKIAYIDRRLDSIIIKNISTNVIISNITYNSSLYSDFNIHFNIDDNMLFIIGINRDCKYILLYDIFNDREYSKYNIKKFSSVIRFDFVNMLGLYKTVSTFTLFNILTGESIHVFNGDNFISLNFCSLSYGYYI